MELIGSAITVVVTVTETPPPPGAKGPASISISVSDDPVDLSGVDEGGGKDNPNAHVTWKIDTPGWEFPAKDGIVIGSHGGKFTDKGPDAKKKEHTWRREKRDKKTDPAHSYKYAITVQKGDVKVTWDPWVVNL